MIGNRRIDVHGVYIRILQELVEIGVAHLDAELVAALVEPFFIAAAEGVHLGKRMVLVDGNEFGPKAEANDRNPDFLAGCHDQVPRPSCSSSELPAWLQDNAERRQRQEASVKKPSSV